VAVRCAVQQFILKFAKSEIPVLHGDPPYWKNCSTGMDSSHILYSTVFAVLDSYISVLNTTSTPGQLNENNESYLPAEVNLYSVTFIIDLLIVSLCLFTSE
jgi:hypothetical protein